MAHSPAVTELRIRRATRRLDVTFEDGHQASLPAEYLRVESPSAEVQGHAPDQKILVTGKEDVNIETADPIGNYAVRIRFTDGHDTGIYTWSYLRVLSTEHDARWQDYLAAVAARGVSRRA